MEIITGKILEVPFVNKIGRIIEGAESLFLEVGKQRYFIKIDAGEVRHSTLKERLGNRIKIEGEIAYGSWDSDDPNVQSRIGAYVRIFSILE